MERQIPIDRRVRRHLSGVFLQSLYKRSVFPYNRCIRNQFDTCPRKGVPMTKLLLFLLVMTFGVFVQSTVGFGGPLIIMPLGLMLLPLGVVKPVTTFTAWLAGLSVLITDYKYINWRELAKMAGVMLIGVLGGMWLTGKLPSNILLPIYGAVVVFIGVQRLFFPTGRQTPKAVKNTALALSGLMQGLFVSGGSFLAIYAVDQLPEKREFRATVNAVWGILNTVMLITFWTSGGLTPEVLRAGGLAIVPTAVAIWLGGQLTRRVKQATFLKIIYVVLIASGAVLLITNL